MREYIRRKIAWKKQSVDEYGGDGEYAGSFTNPDFVNIQRAEPGDCVVAKHAKTGHWYWFWEDDTLLPWARLSDGSRGACEVRGSGPVMFLPSRMHGPFATEAGAKEFGESFARKRVFDEAQQKLADARFEKAKQALTDLLRKPEL